MPTAELTIEAARLLLAADSPQLHFEAGEIAGDVQRQPTRGLHSLPMRAVAVELEIRLAHVIGNLPRRDGQSTKGDARQGAVNELAYALDRPELHLGGEIASQAFGLDIGLDRHHKGGGCEKGPIQDRTLFTTAAFVLAVKANIEAERLRRYFPAQVKLGPVESIRELVNSALPGIALRALPVAPRQIPYYVGKSYFELDRNSPHWKAMQTSGGLALHVAGDFPGLEMELWAIRGQ